MRPSPRCCNWCGTPSSRTGLTSLPLSIPDLPPIIGDQEKLKQVWINLLNNAFDAIGQDGTIWVKTRICPRGRRVLVTVADSGAGIEAEDLKKIFEPFFTTKAPGAGTGLGLSVSFGIIQDHQGTIAALSPSSAAFRGEAGPGKRSPGPGAVFLVELPVSPDEPGADSCEDLVTDLSSYQKTVEAKTGTLATKSTSPWIKAAVWADIWL